MKKECAPPSVLGTVLFAPVPVGRGGAMFWGGWECKVAADCPLLDAISRGGIRTTQYSERSKGVGAYFRARGPSASISLSVE